MVPSAAAAGAIVRGLNESPKGHFDKLKAPPGFPGGALSFHFAACARIGLPQPSHRQISAAADPQILLAIIGRCFYNKEWMYITSGEAVPEHDRVLHPVTEQKNPKSHAQNERFGLLRRYYKTSESKIEVRNGE